MTSTIKKICNDEKISKYWENLKIKLNEYRKIGKYCDYTLKTEDGGNFTVHKCVLEVVSPFFDKMFNSEFNDKNKDTIILKPCSSSIILENIIEFMYNGHVEITSDIARDTLDTSLFLGLENLVKTCSEILIETVNYENCFDLFIYSETYYCGDELTKTSSYTIYKNLEILKDLPSFLQLNFDQIKTLLLYKNDEFNDEDIFLALIEWINFDIENREKFINELMNLLNFNKMNYEFRKKYILNNNPLLDNKYFQLKIIDLLNETWKNNELKEEMIKEENEKQKINLKDIYIFVSNSIRLHENEDFSNYKTISTMDSRKSFAYSTFGENNIFICGGISSGMPINTCKSYSVQEQCWRNLLSMTNNRYYHRTVTLDNKIYACGGSGLNSIEIFDIQQNVWTYGPYLKEVMSQFGLCKLNGCIYAVNKTNFEYYDQRQNSWITLSAYKTDDIRSAFGYNNCIYALTKSGIVQFDLRNNSWSNFKFYENNIIKNMPQVCVVDNKFYSISWIADNESYGRYDVYTYDLPDLKVSSYCDLYKSSDLSATQSYGIFTF